MEYILFNSLISLAHCNNTSLLCLNRILTDPAYRRWIIRQLPDPLLRNFWLLEFERYEPRFQREAVAPILNKVGQLFSNPDIRNILGQMKRKVDFRSMMDSRNVFMANLSKGNLGVEGSNLLGSLIVSQFQMTAMSRIDTPKHARRDFFLYIDEFQNFSTKSFASILSEARKYRLNLVLSHQFTAQLDKEVRDAVFGNCGTLIVFKSGYSDAELFANEFDNEIDVSRITELENHEAFIKTQDQAGVSKITKIHTLPPLDLPRRSPNKLIKLSQERFTEPKQKIEDKHARFFKSAITRPQR
jgi:hypothetical protein